MIKIIDERGTGKTSQLMLIAKQNNAKFVCYSPYMMIEKAKTYGITGIEFISYHDFICKKEDFTYVIDDIEKFIRYFHSGLIGYTDSLED